MYFYLLETLTLVFTSISLFLALWAKSTFILFSERCKSLTCLFCRKPVHCFFFLSCLINDGKGCVWDAFFSYCKTNLPTGFNKVNLNLNLSCLEGVSPPELSIITESQRNVVKYLMSVKTKPRETKSAGVRFLICLHKPVEYGRLWFIWSILTQKNTQ